MKYYKRYNDQFYDFDVAYSFIQNNNLKDVVMRTSNKWCTPSYVEVTWNMIYEQKKNICIPVWAAKSDKWSLWIPDYEKQAMSDSFGDWIENELDFRLDSRFWDPESMSICDWWKQLEDNILIEDDYVEIMNFLRKSGRLKNWNERNKKYYQEKSN